MAGSMTKAKTPLKHRLQATRWAFSLAWKFDKWMLVLWLGLSVGLSVLPAVALGYNRTIIAELSAFLLRGTGSIQDVLPEILKLGGILTLIGLSERVNTDLIYMVMYDKYYFGMEGMMMEAVQTIDIKYLLHKDIKDEYLVVVDREGSLNDFMSSFCALCGKLTGIISLLIVAYATSKAIFWGTGAYFLGALLLNLFGFDQVRWHALFLGNDLRISKHYERLPLDIGAGKEIRIFGLKKNILRHWQEAYKGLFAYDVKRSFGLELRAMISGAAFVLCFVGMILFSLPRVAAGSMPPDVFLMLYALGLNVHKTVATLMVDIVRADYGLVFLERQHKFFTTAPMKKPGEAAKKRADADETAPVFQARNLCFGYDDETLVLRDLNFTIRKGETVALVGHNGSGKSTLVKLLLQLYRPTSGELHFWGKPYEEYEQALIRESIGTFFQDFRLFHAPLRENVAFGDVKRIGDDACIRAAIRKGGAEQVLYKLNDDLDHLLLKDVLPYGAELSGGEKQRIGVSRAHMSDKPIMIFDEPASMLDPLAELEQFKNIKEKLSGRTALLISHRVGFARLADRIIVLDKGRIVETGCHDDLMEKQGVYWNFFHQQAEWYQSPYTTGLDFAKEEANAHVQTG